MRKHRKVEGFRGPADPDAPGVEARRVVLAELAAIAGLTVATLIAATAVSVGIARASALDGVIDNDGGLFTIALILGLAFLAVGGLSLLPGVRKPRH
ncbi:hypothetical protein [Undibacter mobilis]|uniref:Uncharacterized protein n=1 Tax=Undibacter mobilis TaxID=2292256 RepID=A0A371B6X4_9BRAD|nr:hypothetical protein [Undibacter mobilis]RDV03330.1 hypothetical protein DXH78_01230 [Undibacter mobilis]